MTKVSPEQIQGWRVGMGRHEGAGVDVGLFYHILFDCEVGKILDQLYDGDLQGTFAQQCTSMFNMMLLKKNCLNKMIT